MIKNIIFDFGNVFILWDPRRIFKNIVPAGQLDAFMRDIWRDEWNENLDRGATLAENARHLCAHYPEHARYIAYYHEHWRESLGDVDAGSVALLADLKRAGLRAYGLSNWSAETFPIARAEHPFFDMLDGIVISGEVGVCKPDPAIYNILLERHRLLPGECFFIDDRQDNVDAALKLGIAAVRFQSAAQVRATLEAMKIL
ncbi:MAG: HAD family phosphatase [Opitutaceae bacterium]|nr:HAD family phosphatase [Opitutaceae bacterium]